MSCFRQPQFILQDLHPGKSSFSWKPVNKKFYCKALVVAFHISSRKSSQTDSNRLRKGVCVARIFPFHIVFVNVATQAV